LNNIIRERANKKFIPNCSINSESLIRMKSGVLEYKTLKVVDFRHYDENNIRLNEKVSESSQ